MGSFIVLGKILQNEENKPFASDVQFVHWNGTVQFE